MKLWRYFAQAIDFIDSVIAFTVSQPAFFPQGVGGLPTNATATIGPAVFPAAIVRLFLIILCKRRRESLLCCLRPEHLGTQAGLLANQQQMGRRILADFAVLICRGRVIWRFTTDRNSVDY